MLLLQPIMMCTHVRLINEYSGESAQQRLVLAPAASSSETGWVSSQHKSQQQIAIGAVTLTTVHPPRGAP